MVEGIKALILSIAIYIMVLLVYSVSEKETIDSNVLWIALAIITATLMAYLFKNYIYIKKSGDR